MIKMNEQEFIEVSELIHEWRDVEEYEGLYRINEYGDILSIGYKEKKLLKPRMNKDGYLIVDLYKNGVPKHHRVHRLVATVFCEGADYFDEVNHIDEDKTNNHYENLEWCTRRYNARYSLSKKVKCVELDKVFDSVNEASDFVGVSRQNISNCLIGKQKTAGGYTWEYVD